MQAGCIESFMHAWSTAHNILTKLLAKVVDHVVSKFSSLCAVCLESRFEFDDLNCEIRCLLQRKLAIAAMTGTQRRVCENFY